MMLSQNSSQKDQSHDRSDEANIIDCGDIRILEVPNWISHSVANLFLRNNDRFLHIRVP